MGANREPGTENLFQVRATFRVDLADADSQGGVYSGNFFRYFGRARSAYWKAIGCDAAGVRR